MSLRSFAPLPLDLQSPFLPLKHPPLLCRSLRFREDPLILRKRRRRRWQAPVVHSGLGDLFQSFISAFPSINSFDLIAPALGLALFLSSSRPHRRSPKLDSEDGDENESVVGEWILFTTPTPFNRCVLLRCPSVSFEDGGELLDGVNERLLTEERHYVNLSRGRILASKGGDGGLEEVISYQRVCVGTADGGVISLDWPDYLELGKEHGLDTTVLIVPGTTEGSVDINVRMFVYDALMHGCFPIVMNPRGCAGSPLTTARLFTAADSDDICTAIQFINRLRPWTTLMSIGWGYGANMLTKYLAEVGETTSLTAAVCIDNPFDLEEATRSFPHYTAMDQKLTNGLVDILRANKELFQGKAKSFDVAKALSATSIRDFDEAISMISYGFDGIDDFYSKTSTRQSVSSVKIPVLFIQSGDSAAPLFSVPRSSITENPFTSLLLCSCSPSAIVRSKSSAILWCQHIAIEWLSAVEFALLKGRHPLLKDVDITINPSKGLPFVDGKASEKNISTESKIHRSYDPAQLFLSRKNANGDIVMKFTQSSSVNGFLIDPLSDVQERYGDVQDKFSRHSKLGSELHEMQRDDVGKTQDRNVDALQQNNLLNVGLAKVEEDSPIDGEESGVIQTAAVVMNMLDVTMPGTLDDEQKKKKKHLELAKESNDHIEQQRASTQLGRTYHEIFLRSENDHLAVRNAKKYFKLAMKLARTLKENPPCKNSSLFLKEFIDAHNNIGMLEMDLDNLDEAKKILIQGLKICDDEEVTENDDGRSRLNHNLGSLYIELREWSKAREHIEKDILICKRIGHSQGEAKGFINLGELHYRVQKYDDAILCYQKALDIAKRMEDEDALADQIIQNIKTVKEAVQVLEELKKDEQKLKKLMRTTCDARGTSNERKCLLEQNACLDSLIEKSSMIFAWPKHREFAKRKRRVASELCDKEKLGDSFLAIGESYQKLKNFGKARKWYMKSWNAYRSIGNLEGQALAKINIGEVLDSSGDWAGALEAFEEGYRIASQGNLPSVQMSALNNMHYSHMIRFDNIEEARKLQHDIQKLKLLLDEDDVLRKVGNDYCSETETEGGDVSDNIPISNNSPDITKPAIPMPNLVTHVEEFEEDVPLISLFRQNKDSSKMKMPRLNSHSKNTNKFCNLAEVSSRDLGKSGDNQQIVGRKRSRLVISDDEADEPDEMGQSREEPHGIPIEDVATSDGDSMREEPTGTNVQDVLHPTASRDVLSACTPIHIEESTCSFKSKSPKFTANNGMEFGSSSDAGTASAFKLAENGSKMDSGHASGCLLQSQNGAGSTLPEDGRQSFVFRMGNDFIHVDICSCMDEDNLNAEHVKVEVACVYYLQLSEEKRSKGLLPVIGHLEYCGKALDSLESIENIKHLTCGKVWIEVVIAGWVPKRLMKLYVDYCLKLCETPNMKLLKKLYNLEVSEDEIIVSDCGLQDLSISPFLNALEAHKMVAVLDISHNLLGNETMEKVKQIFTSSSQRYGGLTLDLHCNRFGPTALFQICECPVMFARLEMLNLSQNRLTDACSSYLSTILENCKALYSLNIEQCSITSRTIQKVADSLHEGSVLSHLLLGKNNPISGIAMVNLLTKLASLKRFSELSLSGIRLNKTMIDSLCQLSASSSLSGLLLGGTYIGLDAAIRLTEALSSGPQELVKLDLSYCGLTSHDFTKVCANIASLGGVLELNLGGNLIGQEGCDTLGAILVDPHCSLRTLILNKCHLGLMGIVQIIQSLAGNESLEEIHLAENASIVTERALQYDSTARGTPAVQKANDAEVVVEPCRVNAECNGLEVADSEDEATKEEPTTSAPDGSCASSCQRSPFAGSQLIQDLSASISLALQLQLLDLSQNGFSLEAVETLYFAWSSSSSRCGGLARKHVKKDQTIHFSVEGKRCCGVKSCCKRD